MQEEFQKQMKALLEKELEEVKNDLRSIGRINPGNPADWEAVPDKIDKAESDPNEVADSIESYEGNTAILKQLEIRFNEVKEALERINGGIYGLCSECKAHIEDERLKANPAATTCKKHMA